MDELSLNGLLYIYSAAVEDVEMHIISRVSFMMPTLPLPAHLSYLNAGI